MEGCTGSTIGSLSLCRSLLRAGLVDRFRVVMFPVITGATGEERIYDGYPDVAIEMIEHAPSTAASSWSSTSPACSSTRRSAPLRDVAPSAGLDGRQAGERPSVGGGRINAIRDQVGESRTSSLMAATPAPIRRISTFMFCDSSPALTGALIPARSTT